MSGHVATDLLDAAPPAAGVCRDPCRPTARPLQDTVGGDREMVRGCIRRAGKAVRSWHGTAGSPLDAKARETSGVARYNFLSLIDFLEALQIFEFRRGISGAGTGRPEPLLVTTDAKLVRAAEAFAVGVWNPEEGDLDD